MESGAGEDLHVLAVTAPQAELPLTRHVGVAVEAERGLREHLIDRDTVTLGDAELRIRSELHHTPDRLVTRHDREHRPSGHELDAVVLRDVAAAQTDRLD